MLLKVLSEIANHQILNIDKLSERVGVDKPFLNHLLRVLVQEGYLKKQKITVTPERCPQQTCSLKGTCQLELASKRKDQETQPTVYSLTTTGRMILNKRK